MEHDVLEATLKSAPSPGAAAAIWWASVLRDPKFDNGSGDAIGNDMAQMLAKQLSDRNPQNASALERFAGELQQRIDERLEQRPTFGVSLGVDYHPDMILAEAAEAAHLTVGMLGWPWKTHMWVYPTHVSVSYGYRAEPKIIWGEEPPRG